MKTIKHKIILLQFVAVLLHRPRALDHEQTHVSAASSPASARDRSTSVIPSLRDAYNTSNKRSLSYYCPR